MKKFIQKYNSKSQNREELLKSYTPLPSLLAKLGNFYSINGPLLGQAPTNALVNIGMGFLKNMVRGHANDCIADLENKPLSRDVL